MVENYLLFKQTVCLVLFLGQLSIWPRFYLYFGIPVFPGSIFKNWTMIHLFQLLILACLALLFLNLYGIIASFILCAGMRYLFVTQRSERISTLGAVGHLCYIVSAYLFFFEAARLLDKQLIWFIYNIFAVEVAIILFSAVYYKYRFGYLQGRGFEYALVNPSWGKFFFLFNKIKSSSWFFTFNNYAALVCEFFSGVFILFPQTRAIGAYIIAALFIYVFLTVRVHVLPLLMLCISLLYMPPISFHFPVLQGDFPQLSVPEWAIYLIEAVFILYLAIYVTVLIFRPPLMAFFWNKRPCFIWDVFTAGLTDYFVQIAKVSKSTKEVTATLYDGFSQNYMEAFSNPALFFRFISHHESSFALCTFHPVRTCLWKVPAVEKQFIRTIVMYSKTFLSEEEALREDISFTLVHIQKIKDRFSYVPVGSFLVNVQSGTVSCSQVTNH